MGAGLWCAGAGRTLSVSVILVQHGEEGKVILSSVLVLFFGLSTNFTQNFRLCDKNKKGLFY